MRAVTPQYFADDPTVASDPVTIDVRLPDTAFTLETDRGVFARGQLDAGTSLLLRTELPLRPPATARRRLRSRADRAGHGAALAAGDGVGDRRQRTGPLAVRRQRRAQSDHEHPGVRTGRRARPTCCSTRSGRIRRSASARTALHDLLLRWLPRLTPAGSAALVVQKHLGADSLQRWLVAQGLPTERVASKAGYRGPALPAPP